MGVVPDDHRLREFAQRIRRDAEVKRANEALAQARDLASGGDIDAAFEVLNSVVREFPHNAEVQQALHVFREVRERWEKNRRVQAAIAEAEAALERGESETATAISNAR